MGAHTGDVPRWSAAVLGAAFNLTLCAIGAGLLAFPKAFHSSGLVFSVAIAFVFGLINAAVVWFLFHAFNAAAEQRTAHGLPPVRTYEMLMGHFLGRKGYLAAKLGVLVGVIGALIAYFVIIGDIGHPVVQEFAGTHHWYADRRVLIAAFAVLVAFPLSNLRSFKELALASFLAILSVLVTVAVVVVRGSQTLNENGGSLPDGIDLATGSGFFVTASISMFAYGASVSCVAIQAELEPGIRKHSTFILVTAFTMCFVTYSTIGAFGYIRFGDDTKGDVLSNFSVHDHFASVGKLLMLIHVVLAYPVVLFPGRRVIRMWIFRKPDVPPDEVPFVEHTIQTASVVLFTMAVAILVPEVSVVFGLLGGSSFTLVTIILPSLVLYSPNFLGSPAETPGGAVEEGGALAGAPGTPAPLVADAAAEQREMDSLKQSLLDPSEHADSGSGYGIDGDREAAAGAGVAFRHGRRNAWPYCAKPATRELARKAAAAAVVLGAAFGLVVTYQYIANL